MQNPLLFAFIILYLLGTIAIGWWASRRVKSTADFVIAGRQLPLFMAAAALFATWFGSETVMGASSEFIDEGVPGIIEDPFGASLCLVLAGLLVARPLYKRNYLTFSDFFRDRFSQTTEVVSAVFMVVSYFSWIAAQLVALSILLHVVGGIDRDLGLVVCTGMVLVYTYVGGMWAVAITDLVQTVVIIVGLLALAISMVMQVGGPTPMLAHAPEGFFRFLPEAKSISMIEWVAAWMTIGLGSIAQQDVFQRVMAAKSERVAVNACFVSAGMYLSVALLPLVIAYCGRMMYPELLEGDRQLMLPLMVLQHSGLGMQILFFGALLSAILSTASGALLAPATVVGENFVKPLYKNINDAQLLRVMRLSVVVIAIITCGMAASRNNIYELVGESSALSLVGLFIPLVAGLYWKKASATGAITSMVTGVLVWLITLKTFPATPEAAPDNPTWTEVALHTPPIIWGLIASVFGMVAGSLIRKDK